MPTDYKRMSITIPPELEEKLANIKRVQFWDKPQVDAVRYLMERGYKAWQQDREG